MWTRPPADNTWTPPADGAFEIMRKLSSRTGGVSALRDQTVWIIIQLTDGGVDWGSCDRAVGVRHTLKVKVWSQLLKRKWTLSSVTGWIFPEMHPASSGGRRRSKSRNLIPRFQQSKQTLQTKWISSDRKDPVRVFLLNHHFWCAAVNVLSTAASVFVLSPAVCQDQNSQETSSGPAPRRENPPEITADGHDSKLRVSSQTSCVLWNRPDTLTLFAWSHKQKLNNCELTVF